MVLMALLNVILAVDFFFSEMFQFFFLFQLLNILFKGNYCYFSFLLFIIVCICAQHIFTVHSSPLFLSSTAVLFSLISVYF